MGLIKKNGEMRKIEEPSHSVKKIQRKILREVGEDISSDFESFSFCRIGKGPKEAVELFEDYRDHGREWVASLDVKDCYPSINPEDPIGMLDSRISIPGISGRDGLPQGHPLSSLLANVYLDQFDEKVAPWEEDGCGIVRYMDDIWILCEDEEEIKRRYEMAGEIIEDLDLEYRGDIKNVEEGIEVLGFIIDDSSKKPKKSNVQDYKDKIIHAGMELHELMISNSSIRERREVIEEILDSVQGWRNYYGTPKEPWLLETLLEIISIYTRGHLSP